MLRCAVHGKISRAQAYHCSGFSGILLKDYFARPRRALGKGVREMEAVITVIGRDAVGILAKVCTGCAEVNVNVEEVSQRILRGTFAMIMLVDLSAASVDFTAFSEKMGAIGAQLGVDIRCTRQELYDAMHKV